MTTELEQEFYNAFRIKPNIIGCSTGFYNFYRGFRYSCDATNCKKCKSAKKEYPKITAEILLQLLCIYNDMQGCVELCITPCKYEDVEEMILQTLIDEKTNITDYEKGTYMDVMTKQIQQLFKEGK